MTGTPFTPFTPSLLHSFIPSSLHSFTPFSPSLTPSFLSLIRFTHSSHTYSHPHSHSPLQAKCLRRGGDQHQRPMRCFCATSCPWSFARATACTHRGSKAPQLSWPTASASSSAKTCFQGHAPCRALRCLHLQSRRLFMTTGTTSMKRLAPFGLQTQQTLHRLSLLERFSTRAGETQSWEST